MGSYSTGRQGLGLGVAKPRGLSAVREPVRRLVVVCVPINAVVALLGLLQATGTLRVELFNLDAEYTVPAFWSGLLLLVAGLAAVLLFRAQRQRAVIALAVLFAYMGVDEIMSIHENLESATGVDWQVLFAPVILMAAVAFAIVVRQHWGTVAAWVFVAGGALWGFSQVLEKLEWDGSRQLSHYRPEMVVEEIGEMTGSLCFLVALTLLLVAARAGARR